MPTLESKSARAKSPRVLVVDDEPALVETLRSLLGGSLHCRVSHAVNVKEARQALARQEFDLLITDVMLPDGSGLELMRQIQQEHAIRGIAVSGYGMEKDLAGSREAGFSAHIVKPVNVQALLGAIQDLAGED